MDNDNLDGEQVSNETKLYYPYHFQSSSCTTCSLNSLNCTEDFPVI